jgi:murein L,D-transpeptidase YcbB/YkuD
MLSPARSLLMRGCVAAALAAAVLPTEAFALPSAAPPQVEAAIKSYARSDRDLRAFYQAIGYRSLWTDGYSVRPEAFRLIHLLSQSNLDGLDPDEYDPDDLAELVDKAQRGDSPKALAKAETRLSRAFAKYVRDLYRPANVGMIYVDRELAPEPPTTFGTLSAAARATSLQAHLDSVAQINPMYGQLREGLAEHRERWANLPPVTVPAGPALKAGATGQRVQLLRQRLGLSPYGAFDKSVAQALRDFQAAHGIPVDGVAGPRTLAVLNQPPWERERLIELNLERARAVPVGLGDRHVVVDAAAARLYLYEDGQVKDTMKVIVGKPNEPTPMIAGLIRYAVLNPYWNVPADLVKSRVAPHVLKQGTGYLKTMGYEVLSDWSDNARPLDPKTIDWKSVAAGRTLIRVRQQPGPHNAMGRMKFMFPNDMGIWLHDTPDKDLFGESARMFSAGCVRVEDAPRLARWLFGKPLKAGSPAPEQHVALAKPVPVYITYLTAAPSDRGIAIRNDIYKRDRERLARAGRSGGSR